jgi:hypothetical protein
MVTQNQISTSTNSISKTVSLLVYSSRSLSSARSVRVSANWFILNVTHQQNKNKENTCNSSKQWICYGSRIGSIRVRSSMKHEQWVCMWQKSEKPVVRVRCARCLCDTSPCYLLCVWFSFSSCHSAFVLPFSPRNNGQCCMEVPETTIYQSTKGQTSCNIDLRSESGWPDCRTKRSTNHLELQRIHDNDT